MRRLRAVKERKKKISPRHEDGRNVCWRKKVLLKNGESQWDWGAMPGHGVVEEVPRGRTMCPEVNLESRSCRCLLARGRVWPVTPSAVESYRCVLGQQVTARGVHFCCEGRTEVRKTSGSSLTWSLGQHTVFMRVSSSPTLPDTENWTK